MKLKKSSIGMLVLAFTSLILITGSPFQIANNLVENNGYLNHKNIGQEAYAEDGDDGGDSGDDGGDSGDDGGDSGDDDSGGSVDSDDSGDSEESDVSSDESEESSDNGEESDYESEENVDRSYEYEGENEATETAEERAFENQEFQAEEEDDINDDLAVPDGYNSETEDVSDNFGNLNAEPNEQGVDTPEGNPNPLTKENPNTLTKENPNTLTKENPNTLRKPGDTVKKENDHDDDDHPKQIIKKYYRGDKDDDNDDVKDVESYNMGYRNGKFDRINKMPFNDAFPFDDKDGRTWYQVGYRSGWDSGK